MRSVADARRGIILPIVAVLLTALIGIGAFAVDLARWYLMRAQLQTAADAFFATGSSALNAESQAKLADLVDKTKAVNLEVIIAVGHTDITGSAALNQRLSVQRAESVKKFLVGKGVEANRVYTEGKGAANPVADNKTAEGRAKNRRVEVEVVGTRTRRP